MERLVEIQVQFCSAKIENVDTRFTSEREEGEESRIQIAYNDRELFCGPLDR